MDRRILGAITAGAVLHLLDEPRRLELIYDDVPGSVSLVVWKHIVSSTDSGENLAESTERAFVEAMREHAGIVEVDRLGKSVRGYVLWAYQLKAAGGEFVAPIGHSHAHIVGAVCFGGLYQLLDVYRDDGMLIIALQQRITLDIWNSIVRDPGLLSSVRDLSQQVVTVINHLLTNHEHFPPEMVGTAGRLCAAFVNRVNRWLADRGVDYPGRSNFGS